jgi:hypothetical protein
VIRGWAAALGGPALAHAGHLSCPRRRCWPGERQPDAVGAALREAAAELVGGPPTDETVRRALGSLAAQHPDDASIVDLAKVTMSEATDFVREHDVVSLVDDPCVIEEMPEFARGVAVAYCDPPGPLETADVPTFYCIAPDPADWPPERVESFYREYNDHMIREPHRARGDARATSCRSPTPAVPRRHPGPGARLVRPVRRGLGGLRRGADGRLSASAGSRSGLQQLKMQLRMSINAIIDQLVHCET